MKSVGGYAREIAPQLEVAVQCAIAVCQVANLVMDGIQDRLIFFRGAGEQHAAEIEALADRFAAIFRRVAHADREKHLVTTRCRHGKSRRRPEPPAIDGAFLYERARAAYADVPPQQLLLCYVIT